MKEMKSEVEAYKALKEDYNHLEGYCSDLKLQIREKELQAQIEIEKAALVKENIKLLMVIYIFMKRKQMDHMMNLGLLQMRKFIGSCQNIYGNFLLMM